MLTQAEPAVSGHGAGRLTAVHIDTYKVELRDEADFIGDRASVRAFRAILDDVRERVSQADEDTVGDVPSKDIRKKKLDRLLVDGDPKAAGVVIGTVEELAQEFATVIGRFLRLDGWRGTQRIVVGAGLRASRIGELAIGRTSVILKGSEHEVQLTPIRHDPDEAGLVGCIHLVPSWAFSGHDGILAVDIGGSNIRVGIVEPNLRRPRTCPKPRFRRPSCGATPTTGRTGRAPSNVLPTCCGR